VFLIDEKILQDHEQAIVPVFHLTQRFLVPLVKRAGGITCDHEHSAPNGEVKPAGIEGQLHLAGKHGWVGMEQQDNQTHASKSGERGVPATEVIGGI
jgi:hypothetical protein